MSTEKPKSQSKKTDNINYTRIISVLVFSIILLSVSGCTDTDTGNNHNIEKSPVSSVTLTTDNDTYRSSEEMVITVDIIASRDVDTALVNISGIKNTFERNMLEDGKTVYLTKGNNIVDFTFKTPSCSDCSGVLPGNHTIYAIAEIGGTQYNATAIVILEADVDETDKDGNLTKDLSENMTKNTGGNITAVKSDN